MTWLELQHWVRFDALHPMPDRLADLHHGILMAAIVNITRSPEAQPAVPADFFVLRDRFAEPEVARPGETEADRVRRLMEG